MKNNFRPNVNLAAMGSKFGERVVQLIPQLRENYEVAKELTERLNPERKLNISYYFGRQWAFWDGNVGEVKSREDTISEFAPVTLNVLAPQLDTRVANLVNGTPMMDVTAATDEMSDVAAADLANQAAMGMWSSDCLPDTYSRLHKTAGMRYNCFLKTLFDPYAGDIGDDGEPMGEIVDEVIPPERVYVDPLADRVMPERKLSGDARWLFELCTQDIGFVINHPSWKEAREEKTEAGNTVIYAGVPDADDIKDHDSIAASTGEHNLGDVLGIDQTKAAQGASTFAKKGDISPHGKIVRIVYYYEHKSPNYPHGRFAAFLPDNDWHVLEYRDELPYATKEHKTGLFPWVMAVDVFVAGTLAGRCRMTGARPPQDELNIAATSWRTTRGAMPPMFLADRSSGITAQKLRGAGPATIFEYDSTIGGNPPTAISQPAVNQEAQLAMQEIQTLTRLCEDQMDAHSIATYPRNSATTLGEMEIMRLEDETKLKTNDVKRAEQTVYAPHIKTRLRLMQRFYTEPRMLMFFGAEGRGSLKRFMGSELHFKDVRILPGTSSEANRSLKVALSIRYMELVATTPMEPDEAKQFRLDMGKMLDLQITHSQTTNQKQAKKQLDECFRILDGEKNILPGPFDDPAIHCQTIVDFAISPEVENLPQPRRNDVLQELTLHYDYHKQAGVGVSPEAQNAVAAATAEPGTEEEVAAGMMTPPEMPLEPTGMPLDIGSGGKNTQTAPAAAPLSTIPSAGAIP